MEPLDGVKCTPCGMAPGLEISGHTSNDGDHSMFREHDFRVGRKSYSLDVNDPPFVCIDHVQLAMPAGLEDQARAFYSGLLKMVEIEKPAELKKRGGCWFQSGAVQIHLGVEVEFRPAKKAHPALRCFDYDALTTLLRAAGVDAKDDSTIPGVQRCHVSDPFGNRIELIRA